MNVLRSKYLLTEPHNVIENGAVLIDEGKIRFAGNFESIHNPESYPIMDLGDSALVPGFVNAHTHLELTHLRHRIEYNGDFTDWIRQVINAKKNWTEQEYASSVRDGITNSLEAGTTTVADITRTGLALGELTKSKIRKILFYELIDFNPDSAADTIEGFRKLISDVQCDDLLSLGIYPHAPYTVSAELYRESKKISEELGIRIATHIAETADEVEFLTGGTGRFASLLNDFGMLGDWKYPGLRPVNYLKNIGFLESGCILVHGNYLTEKEMDHIEKTKSHVIFCPRSHKYFRHTDHSFRKISDRGINVALGTDSLASNDSLSMLDEMKYVSDNHKEMKPHDIFYMGTIAGAAALGMKDRIGKLEPGFEADIAVIEFNDTGVSDIFDGIFSTESECVFTLVSGTICYDKYGISKEKA